MKIKSFIVFIVLAGTILSFGFPVAAQTTNNQALIAQLQAIIQNLIIQINQLLAQQRPATGISGAPSCHNFTVDLYQGVSNSTEVSALQRELSRQGFYNGLDVAGVFGTNTRSAVINFQNRHGIQVVWPGTVGEKTRMKLNQFSTCSSPISASKKTYINSQYGFEFDYPADWVMEGNQFYSTEDIADRRMREAYPGTGSAPRTRLAVSVTNSPPAYVENQTVVAGKEAFGSCISSSKDDCVIYIKSNSNYYVLFSTSQTRLLPNESYSDIIKKLLFDPDVKAAISSLRFTSQPAYLIAAYSKNGKNYIDVDYVEWLHGNASIQAQVEDGKCASASECYDFPNGYKQNLNPLVRTFEVSPSASIVVNGEISAEINKLDNTQLSNPYGRNLSITFNKLKEAVSAMGTLGSYTSPFKAPKAFITIDVKSNVVTKISEPYQE